MQRLGGFLIDKGLISSQQLAEALLEQLKKTPPSLGVLYENGSLGAQDVLDILRLQGDKFMDFRTACVKLELWRDEYDVALQSELALKRPKLGQILIEKDWLDPQRLLAELHGFQAYCEENTFSHELKKPLAVVPINKAKQTTSVGEELPVARAEFNPSFANVEAESVPDYLDLFSEEKKNALEITILSVESLGDDDKLADDVYETLDAFFGEYHSLKGAARSIGAALTERLIHEAEDLLTFFKRFSSKVETNDFVQLGSINLQVLDLLWALRDELLTAATEEQFWANDSSQLSYLSLLDDLHKMLWALNSRGYEVSLDEVNDMF
ncbi:MAG: hypothetical protein V3T17_12355 [Pseudomonadales bacterium]